MGRLLRYEQGHRTQTKRFDKSLTAEVGRPRLKQAKLTINTRIVSLVWESGRDSLQTSVKQRRYTIDVGLVVNAHLPSILIDFDLNDRNASERIGLTNYAVWSEQRRYNQINYHRRRAVTSPILFQCPRRLWYGGTCGSAMGPLVRGAHYGIYRVLIDSRDI